MIRVGDSYSVKIRVTRFLGLGYSVLEGDHAIAGSYYHSTMAGSTFCMLHLEFIQPTITSLCV